MAGNHHDSMDGFMGNPIMFSGTLDPVGESPPAAPAEPRALPAKTSHESGSHAATAAMRKDEESQPPDFTGILTLYA